MKSIAESSESSSENVRDSIVKVINDAINNTEIKEDDDEYVIRSKVVRSKKYRKYIIGVLIDYITSEGKIIKNLTFYYNPKDMDINNPLLSIFTEDILYIVATLPVTDASFTMRLVFDMPPDMWDYVKDQGINIQSLNSEQSDRFGQEICVRNIEELKLFSKLSVKLTTDYSKDSQSETKVMDTESDSIEEPGDDVSVSEDLKNLHV